MKTLTILAVVTCLAPAQGPWKQLADPAAAGWDATRLAKARAVAEQAGSAAVFIVHRGTVVTAWGEVERRFKCHSVRKSIMSALAGQAVHAGEMSLEETVGELGMDDLGKLTDVEKGARVVDLLAARSGIYHPAAKEPADMRRERPKRGSAAPGKAFFYNNWDFNTLGTIFEKKTGKTLFAAFEARLAKPLGMEDWSSGDGTWELEPTKSRYPAYAFRLSARDLARFGLLFARGGKVGDAQVVDAGWVTESTSRKTSFESGHGYGYMWWVYPKRSLGRYEALNRNDVIAAIGTGGQIVLVVPALDFVLVHRADTDNDRGVPGGRVWAMAEHVLAAMPDTPVEAPELAPVRAIPLPGVMPPPPSRRAVTLPASRLRGLVGSYDMGRMGRARIFLHEGRLFATTSDGNEAELFAESADAFFVKTSKVTIRFARDEEGVARSATISMMGREIEAKRIP